MRVSVLNLINKDRGKFQSYKLVILHAGNKELIGDSK